MSETKRLATIIPQDPTKPTVGGSSVLFNN
jgi:hypothetical protein